MPKSRPGAFKPRESRKESHSSNPKTETDRLNISSKRGIEVAIVKARGAFRVSKSRALSKLRSSGAYALMNEAQCQMAEQEVEEKETAILEEKIRNLEMEWRFKVENGIVDSDEDLPEHDLPAKVVHERPARTRKRQRDTESPAMESTAIESTAMESMAVDSELIISDDNDDQWSDCEGQDDLLQLGSEFIDIMNRHARVHARIVRSMERKGKKHEDEYREYEEGRLAELEANQATGHLDNDAMLVDE